MNKVIFVFVLSVAGLLALVACNNPKSATGPGGGGDNHASDMVIVEILDSDTLQPVGGSSGVLVFGSPGVSFPVRITVRNPDGTLSVGEAFDLDISVFGGSGGGLSLMAGVTDANGEFQIIFTSGAWCAWGWSFVTARVDRGTDDDIGSNNIYITLCKPFIESVIATGDACPGEEMTITGRCFCLGGLLLYDEEPILYTLVSDTEIKFNIPGDASGSASIVYVNPDHVIRGDLEDPEDYGGADSNIAGISLAEDDVCNPPPPTPAF